MNQRMLASCKNFDAFGIGAFRQPDAARVAAETTAVMVARRQDLRAERRRMAGQQRQQRVRRGGGDDFHAAFVLEFAERADEIAVPGLPRVADGNKPVVIHPRQFAEGAVPVRAVDFLFGQFDEAVEMPLVALRSSGSSSIAHKRRRERKRQARVHAVAPPAFQHLQQRDVGFGDGFEEPAFLQKLFVLRMAHERQVRVQNEG
jgi:hypothetical protein